MRASCLVINKVNNLYVKVNHRKQNHSAKVAVIKLITKVEEGLFVTD